MRQTPSACWLGTVRSLPGRSPCFRPTPLTGNSDAHLKNLSFLVSHEGVHPAPLYDLLSVAAYDTPAFGKEGWPAHTQLAWPVLGVRRFSELNRGLLLEAGAALNLARGTAQRLLENLRSRAMPEAEALYAEVEAENAEIARARPDLSATLAGECRCLRTIVHTIVGETTRLIA